MKILVSAIACNPLWGSEAAVGWATVAALAREHQVWVLLNSRHREYFETWGKSNSLSENIHLHFVGEVKPYHPNRMIARIGNWTENFAWQRDLLQHARKLHQEIDFDLVHHVTYATWRMASPLWQLGVPFVWGPLGGSDFFPWQCAAIFSPAGLLFELARHASNLITRHTSSIRQCARNATLCVGGNWASYRLLSSIRGTEQGVARLCGNFLSESKIESFKKLLPRKTTQGALRIFAGGNLEGHKGVAIALFALTEVKKAGVPFTYRLGGSGAEAKHLQELSEKLGIADSIIFGESLHGDAYQEELLQSHIYLLPSLREYAGKTLMEAMLAGCVPIVAARGGPAEIVTDECGFRVPASSPRQMGREMAQIILRLNKERNLLEPLSQAAHERIATEYSEDKYLESINALYLQALKQ